MKRTTSFFIGAALIASAAVLPLAAMAQTNQATMMPVLYNQSGAAVNSGTAAVPAGTYYLQPGGSQPVYYYGNGTYYNAATGEYGGSTTNPNGTSGASLGYTTTSGTVSSPGVPNTGAGGDSANTWALLIVSGAVVLAGAVSLGYAFSRPNIA